MIDLIIEPDGDVRMIYDERIDMRLLGAPSICRASHVEPVGGGLWMVDLSPVGGPVLGPFVRRSEAIGVEIDWLNANWLRQGVP